MNDNGMELYFAETALNDAILTGENQIFLSSSPMRSDVLRDHVVTLAAPLDITLWGGFVILPNDAKLIFLNVDNRVMSAFSGNVYVINCFNKTSFSYVSELASMWAMLKKHRVVFFSADETVM